MDARLNWNPNITVDTTAQKVVHRSKIAGGAFLSTLSTPANDLPTSATTADILGLPDNIVQEFRILNVCASGELIPNTEGTKEKIGFACILPTATHTSSSITATVAALPVDITNVIFTLYNDDGSVAQAASTIAVTNNVASKNFNSLNPGTQYNVGVELIASVDGAQVTSNLVTCKTAVFTDPVTVPNCPSVTLTPGSSSVTFNLALADTVAFSNYYSDLTVELLDGQGANVLQTRAYTAPFSSPMSYAFPSLTPVTNYIVRVKVTRNGAVTICSTTNVTTSALSFRIQTVQTSYSVDECSGNNNYVNTYTWGFGVFDANGASISAPYPINIAFDVVSNINATDHRQITIPAGQHGTDVGSNWIDFTTINNQCTTEVTSIDNSTVVINDGHGTNFQYI